MKFRVGWRDTFHFLKRIQQLEHLILGPKLVSLADKTRDLCQVYSFNSCSIFLLSKEN